MAGKGNYMFYLTNVQLLYGWMPFTKRTTDYQHDVGQINGDNPACLGKFKFGYYVALLNLTEAGKADLDKDGTVVNGTLQTSSILNCDALDDVSVYIKEGVIPDTPGLMGKFVDAAIDANDEIIYPEYGIQIKSFYDAFPGQTVPAGKLLNDHGWFEVGNWDHNDASLFANRILLTIPENVDPPGTVIGPFTHYMLYKRAVVQDASGGGFTITNANEKSNCYPICIWEVDPGSFNFKNTNWITGAGEVTEGENNSVKLVAGDQFYIKFGGEGTRSANYNGVVMSFDNYPYG